MICNVSRPFNIASDLAEEGRTSGFCLAALFTRQNIPLGFLEERDRPNVLVACAAETIILALSQYRSRHLCGRLDVATIEELARFAEGLGFSVAT